MSDPTRAEHYRYEIMTRSDARPFGGLQAVLNDGHSGTVLNCDHLVCINVRLEGALATVTRELEQAKAEIKERDIEIEIYNASMAGAKDLTLKLEQAERERDHMIEKHAEVCKVRDEALTVLRGQIEEWRQRADEQRGQIGHKTHIWNECADQLAALLARRAR